MIHNFVNVDMYKPLPDAARRIKVLLHISNFRPVKRVLDCIRILAQVRQHGSGRQLLMVGDGPDRGPAEMLARELGVRTHVNFLGKQDHVERLIPKGARAVAAERTGGVRAGGAGGDVVRRGPGRHKRGRRSGSGHRRRGRVPGAGWRHRAVRPAGRSNCLTDRRCSSRMAAAARKTAVDGSPASSIIPQVRRALRDRCWSEFSATASHSRGGIMERRPPVSGWIANSNSAKKSRNCRHCPECTCTKTSTGRCLYVGKAKNLRSRVRSYFNEDRLADTKTGTLISVAHDIDFIQVDNNKEALALENNLIKQYKPRFNILLRDDKTYPYIKLTGEKYPRVYVTRRLEKGRQHLLRAVLPGKSGAPAGALHSSALSGSVVLRRLQPHVQESMSAVPHQAMPWAVCAGPGHG